MKDEIKEILDELKNEDNYIEDYGFRYKRIALDDVWHLLNYITNLQEENERLHNLIVQHIDKEDNLIDYKSIIDKAIEYIKSSIENSKPDLYNDDLDDLHILLNILQGSDKE